MNISKTISPLSGDKTELLLNNPDRGFRTETVWYVKETAQSANPRKTLEDKLDSYFKPCFPETVRLDMVYVYLTDYRDMDIPKEGLDTIQLFFNILRERKIKIMLRFAYCYSWKLPQYSANQDTILNHLRQLAPLVATNCDVIHTIQSGFVGSYGEWASCYQDPPVDYTTILKGIMENLIMPNDIYFQIRLPEYKNLLSGYPEYYERMGIDSCAFFGEQNKYGWESGSFQMGNENGQWEQLTRESATTPQDGELFVNVNLVETKRMVVGTEAIQEFAHHRFTTFSCWHGYKEIAAKDEDTTVMYQWKKSPITEEWLQENKIVYCPSWFLNENGEKKERNVFEFVRDHLGYLLEAKNIELNMDEKFLKISLTLKNYGFSVCFNLKSGFAILDENNNIVDTVYSGSPNTWYSHNPDNQWDNNILEHLISGEMKKPIVKGKYKLSFFMNNSLGDHVRLNNEVEYIKGHNILCNFNI